MTGQGIVEFDLNFAFREADVLQFLDHGGATPVMRAYAISCPMCSLA